MGKKQVKVDIFELDNFPINDKVLEGAKAGNPIDMLHVQLRGFSILNFKLDDVQKTLKCYDRRVKQLEKNDKIQDLRIEKLEAKVEDIVRKIA
jgi:vacuolar-type H+-ATPase subunit I/STV1